MSEIYEILGKIKGLSSYYMRETVEAIERSALKCNLEGVFLNYIHLGSKFLGVLESIDDHKMVKELYETREKFIEDISSVLKKKCKCQTSN